MIKMEAAKSREVYHGACESITKLYIQRHGQD